MLNAFTDPKLISYEAYCLRSDTAMRPMPNDVLQGKKGANLLRLLNLNIATPKFVILTTDLFNSVGVENIDYNKLIEQIMLTFPEFPGQFGLSVRPAGFDTMPGIYETTLDIRNREDLKTALQNAYVSWNDPAARVYRTKHNISENTGMALIVQKMVYGNAGERSGSGAFYTRDVQTGADEISGTYYRNALGDETMTGSDRVPSILDFANAERDFGPESHGVDFFKQFKEIKRKLEDRFRRPQEVEFTVERGTLYILQTRDAEMPNAVIYKLDNEKINERGLATKPFLAESLSPGVVAGRLAFSLERARVYRQAGDKVILVVQERTEEYLQALVDREFDGLLTFYGNFNMHDARIARELGIPGISILNNRLLKGDSLIILDQGVEKYLIEGMVCTLDGWENERKKGHLYDKDYTDYIIDGPKAKKSNEADTQGISLVEKHQKINIKDISNFVKAQLAERPLKDIYILHSILRAMIDSVQTKDSRLIEIIDLDIALDSLHELIKEKEKSLNLEQLNIRLYSLYRGFENYQTGFTVPQTVEEFLTQAPKIISQIYQRYGNNNIKIAALDHCDYMLSQGGYHNQVAFDRELPLNFSIVFENKQADLSGINFNLLTFVQDINLFFHYVAYDNERDASGRLYQPRPEDWTDLLVQKIMFVPDKLHPGNIRVLALIEMPCTANFIESSFYLDIGGCQKIWLKTNSFEERLVIRKAQKSTVGFYELLLDEGSFAKKKYAEYLADFLQKNKPSFNGIAYPYSKTNFAQLVEAACDNWHKFNLVGERNADGTQGTVQNVDNESIYDWPTRTLFKLIDLLFPGEITVAQSEWTEDCSEIGEGWVKVFKETKFAASDILKSKLTDLLSLLQQNNVNLEDAVLESSDYRGLYGINLDNLILYIYKCLVENDLQVTPERSQDIYAVFSPKTRLNVGTKFLSVADWEQLINNQPETEWVLKRILEKNSNVEVWQKSSAIETPYKSDTNPLVAADINRSVYTEVDENGLAYDRIIFALIRMHYSAAAVYLQKLFDLETPEYKEVKFLDNSFRGAHEYDRYGHYSMAALLVNAEFKEKLAVLLAEMSRYVSQEAFYEIDEKSGEKILSLVKITQIHRQLREAGLIQ